MIVQLKFRRKHFESESSTVLTEGVGLLAVRGNTKTRSRLARMDLWDWPCRRLKSSGCGMVVKCDNDA